MICFLKEAISFMNEIYKNRGEEPWCEAFTINISIWTNYCWYDILDTLKKTIKEDFMLDPVHVEMGRFVRLRWMVTVGDFAMNFEDWNEKKKNY